jgi:hypothetical protein
MQDVPLEQPLQGQRNLDAVEGLNAQRDPVPGTSAHSPVEAAATPGMVVSGQQSDGVATSDATSEQSDSAKGAAPDAAQKLLLAKQVDMLEAP